MDFAECSDVNVQPCEFYGHIYGHSNLGEAAAMTLPGKPDSGHVAIATPGNERQ